MNFRLVALLAAVLALGAQPLRAQETQASECCILLLPPAGARALSLGNALTARNLPDGLWVNPASIASLRQSELRVHTERSEFVNKTAMTLAFGIGHAGVAGISYRLFDYGETEGTSETGEPLGSIPLAEQMLAINFATTLLSSVRAGIQYNVFQNRNTDESSAITQLVDFGVQYDVPWPRTLQLGLAVLHVGPRLQVKNAEQADPPPRRIRVGAAYEVLQHFVQDSTVQLVASADLNLLGADEEPSLASGLELFLDQSLFIRAGYATGTGTGTGAAVGVGLLYDRFDVSVAKAFSSAQDVTDAFQVTLAVRF
jgi:hypothetical protein